MNFDAPERGSNPETEAPVDAAQDPGYDGGASFSRVFLDSNLTLGEILMHRFFLYTLSALVICLGTSTIVRAAGHNLTDYPLRVHIFQFNSHSHYYQRSLDMVDGEGRANLYENSEPRGFDFSYHCGDRLMVSSGFETYPARWKKPGQSIEVLQPVFGKPGAFEACEMKVEMKETAYYKHNGLLNEEPIAVFKAWMEKRQYDPEHGKNEPQPAPVPANAPAPAPDGVGPQ
jgi:hypothetical protein